MKSFYLTDSGKVRSHNDDYLLAVADGMGGHKAGEVASSMVVTHLGKRFTASASIGSKVDAINWIKDNINEINKEILDYAVKYPEATGLGTTAVLAILTKDYLIFGNIGDSSGFVYKDKVLHKVTHDHTLVNILVANGELSEEEAKYHPKKNVLLKALGSNEKADIDIFCVDSPVDGIFLCSDGLTNMLTKEQIEKVLSDEELEIEEKVIKLIRKSNARGGTDNISIAYLSLEDEKEDKEV